MLLLACFLLCLNHEPKFLGTWFVKILWSLVLSVFLFLLPHSWTHYQPGICWNENLSSDYFVYMGNLKSASLVGLWVGILREDFYCFFFPLIQSQGQDKQVFLLFLSVKLFLFLTHWELWFLGRPGFMEESQIDFTSPRLPSFVSSLLSSSDVVTGTALRFLVLGFIIFSTLASQDFLSS